jgi:ADP-ribose pyrophosphatase YjhB (NUDIX family)
MTKPIKQPKFKPSPGQVDFTNIHWAPVINCVVKYKGKILLVKRSKSLKLYPNLWNGISGFLDDKKSFKEKVAEELGEETAISSKNIKSIKLGAVFNLEAPKYKKTWIVHPVLVEVKTNKVKLDWESQSFEWINPKDAKKKKLAPGFKRVLENFF